MPKPAGPSRGLLSAPDFSGRERAPKLELVFWGPQWGGGNDLSHSLSISNGGSFDLNSDVLRIHYPPGLDPLATIRSHLTSPVGLRSATPAAAGEALALADSRDGVVSGLPANTLLVQSALPGDVNLDGKVDFSDLVILASRFGRAADNWDQADFDYDGRADFQDLVTLAANYNRTLPAAAAVPAATVGHTLRSPRLHSRSASPVVSMISP